MNIEHGKKKRRGKTEVEKQVLGLDTDWEPVKNSNAVCRLDSV